MRVQSLRIECRTFGTDVRKSVRLYRSEESSGTVLGELSRRITDMLPEDDLRRTEVRQ